MENRILLEQRGQMSAFRVTRGNLKPGIWGAVSPRWCNIHLPREWRILKKKKKTETTE